MKEKVLRLFDNNILSNKVLVKLWDTTRNKWYFEVIDVKQEEEKAIISYNELLNKKSE